MAKVTTALFGDLAFLPFPAQAPMTEVLEWNTDLMTSFNGTENRIQLRNHPRQTLTYEIAERQVGKLRAYLTYYDAMRLKWAVPLWAEVQFLGTVVTNTQIISCNTTNYDFRAGSLALLYQNNDVWQVVSVAEVGADSITIEGYTDGFQSAYLMPVRLGYIRDNVERSSNGYEGDTKVRFEIEDILALPESIPGQFLGSDLYLEPGLFADGRQAQTLTTRTDRVDYELGLVDLRRPWKYNRDIRVKHVICDGAAEVRAWRRWLMRRAGRLRAYWEPTFENDLRHTSTGTVTDKLWINHTDGFNQWGNGRTHIAIRTFSGVWYCRTVTGIATPAPAVVQLSLDTALNIPASSIQQVSFIGLRRLDTDRVELNWLGNSVIRASVNTVEIRP